MIRISHLVKVYKGTGTETLALNKICFGVKEGEFVAVMGPSGCGKSTLLNILGLLDVPDSGSFQLLGESVENYNENKLALLRKQSIGFIFQAFNLIDQLTVYENVELPLKYTGMKPGERKKRVEILLERMNVADRRNYYPHQLSGGQQQRVAVARALVNKPPLLLADEPTGNLDSANGLEVMNILKELNEGGTTIVMVTHSEHDAGFSNRTVKMLDGKIVSGEPVAS